MDSYIQFIQADKGVGWTSLFEINKSPTNKHISAATGKAKKDKHLKLRSRLSLFSIFNDSYIVFSTSLSFVMSAAASMKLSESLIGVSGSLKGLNLIQ